MSEGNEVARQFHEAARTTMRSVGIGGAVITNRAGTVVDVALLDIADEPAISALRWGLVAAHYAGNHRQGLLHRHLMQPPPGTEVDHINGDVLDNRRSNLRVVSGTINSQNLRPRSGGTSAFRGVAWHKAARKWRAYGRLNGRHVHLGLYLDEMEAEQEARQFRAIHDALADELDDRLSDFAEQLIADPRYKPIDPTVRG